MKKSNIISTIIGIIGILLMLWFAASWIDIISDNTSENPQHADWNAFNLIVGREGL